jgi:vacuolar-type H+-ATPase subunit I/STV1
MNVFLTGAKDVDTLKKRLEKYLQSIIDVNKEFAANEELKNTIEEIGSKEKELQKLRNELTEFKNQVAKKHLKAFEIKANSEGFEV